MKSKITIVTLDNPYVSGVVVEADYLTEPLVVFPPEPSTVHPALWLDHARIVMVHGPIHKAQVSIYNIKDRRFEKHVAASGLCTPLLLSHDKRNLLGVHYNGFSVCDLEGEAGCVHHRTAAWDKNGEFGRFIN
jgi:hypothetical protein